MASASRDSNSAQWQSACLPCYRTPTFAFGDEVIGPRARAMARALRPGNILLLQNLRFHPGEKEDGSDFAAELAGLGDVYVNDAFAVCHRKHASLDAVPRRFLSVARATGLLVEREVGVLDRVLKTEAPDCKQLEAKCPELFQSGVDPGLESGQPFFRAALQAHSVALDPVR